MAETKVQTTTSTIENDDGTEREVTQYRTTIPKELAEALDLKDAELEWKVDSGNSLKVMKK
jgi:bifunctional DNA-binding transcriptional regulator/antitoxin component of YhaV-PrlF toxin-antitoxin module